MHEYHKHRKLQMKHARKTAIMANSYITPFCFGTNALTAAGEKGGDRVRTTSGQTSGGAAKNRQAASGRDDNKGDDGIHRETNNEGGGLFLARVVRPVPATYFYVVFQARVEQDGKPVLALFVLLRLRVESLSTRHMVEYIPGWANMLLFMASSAWRKV